MVVPKQTFVFTTVLSVLVIPNSFNHYRKTVPVLIGRLQARVQGYESALKKVVPVFLRNVFFSLLLMDFVSRMEGPDRPQ